MNMIRLYQIVAVCCLVLGVIAFTFLAETGLVASEGEPQVRDQAPVRRKLLAPDRVQPPTRVMTRSIENLRELDGEEGWAKLQELRIGDFAGCGARERGLLSFAPVDETEASSLEDPFGSRVFNPAPSTNRISMILDLLRGGEDNPHQVFVVSEWIKQQDPDARPSFRRCVITFSQPPLDRSVMISVSFNSAQFPEQLRPGDVVEIWGWDESRGVFNYYEWIGPDWVLAGSTPTPTNPQNSNRCLECHRTGVPVMKELRNPWVNWQSTESPNSYLVPGNPTSWTVTAGGLPPIADADKLEGLLRTAIIRANQRSIAREISQVAGDGTRTVRNVPMLVQPVFVAREFNLAASRTASRLGVADPPFQAEPPAHIEIPNSFFLSSTLIAGGEQGVESGLGHPAARGFARRTKLPLSEYAKLVRDPISPLQLSPTFRPGDIRSGVDATFAWSTPERSFVDDNHVQELIKQNVVTTHFVAAALLTDLRHPVFSTDLRQVFETPDLFPSEFALPTGTADGNHRDHPLTRHVLNRLSVIEPEPDTPLGRFRANLLLDDPVSQLRNEVDKYRAEVEAVFADPADVDMAKVKEWYGELLIRRRAVLNDPELRVLDETRSGGRSLGLLPLP